MKNMALMVAGIIFLLVGLAHVVRLAYHIEIMAGGHVLPMGISVAGFIFAILMSAWMFRAMRG